MTKLNKIAQVLVLSGMSCWVSIAQAADVEISQSTNINQQNHKLHEMVIMLMPIIHVDINSKNHLFFTNEKSL